MASIQELLRPITLTKVISRVAASTQTLLQFMDMGPGGKNTTFVNHGRDGSYHVYNNVRTVAQGRAPGTAAARSARNAMGRVPFTYPRMHDSIALPAEELHNLAQIADPRTRDVSGTDYIRRQTMTLGQKAGNWRTALLVGMLRDSLYLVPSGDTLYPSYSDPGGAIRVNYGMPAANKSQLDMLGDGDIIDVPWNSPGANIPSHLLQINAAMQELNGGTLTDVFITSTMWSNITTNDYVATGAGFQNAPFTLFERAVGKGPDGVEINEQIGKINTVPWVTFHITDNGLEVGAPGSETYTKHIADTAAVFMQSPSTGNYTMYEGSEPIAEFDGGPETVKSGFASWSTKASNPTSTNIFVLDNALPVNHIPTSIAYGTVVF